MTYDTSFRIGERVISGNSPTYFIADIGANHDGSLHRATDLIKLAKDAGADCAKFQHFRAKDIVSDRGFDGLKLAHQAKWAKSVYEVYSDYSINRDWNIELAMTANEVGIDFMTTPYDFEAVDSINHLVKAFKIGSGDITYHQLIRHIAGKGKPVFLATGASQMVEVMEAAEQFLMSNRQLCLMQCNTNYTGDMENFRYVNLKVLPSFRLRWPGLPLGLSDHTPGHACVLGAIALGARVIEKHFTDDHTRKGPDHEFALNPIEWGHMIKAARQLEMALGDGKKIVEDNEVESRVVQRRAVRAKRNLIEGSIITASDVEFLRPCPDGAVTPAQVDLIIGSKIRCDFHAGDAITRSDVYDVYI